MKTKITLLLLVLIILGVFYINYSKKEKVTIPLGIHIDKNTYPITGIDLSNHSGKVDFKKLKKEKIDFIYFKVSEGENHKDKSFEKYYKSALKNDFLIGYYHFYRFDKNPIKQAHFFIKQLKGKKHSLPLVIDVEEWGNKINKPKKDIIKDIGVFIKTIEKLSNKKVMIYTNESGYKTYIQKQYDDYLTWICSFKKTIKIDNKWTLWQHSHKARYDSVEGWVDLNTFNGNQEQWDDFVKKINE